MFYLLAQTDPSEHVKPHNFFKLGDWFAFNNQMFMVLVARCLERIGPGDTLVVVRIDRLARSLAHLLGVIECLRARGAHFRSLGDPIDTASPQASSPCRCWAPPPSWNGR